MNRFFKIAVVYIAQSIFMTSTVLALDNHQRPDYHAPIGVMRDHVHDKGDIMFSYRYSLMKMQGLRQGTDKISTNAASATTNYMMLPLQMDMHMHMLGVMYGVTDNLTLSAMGSVIEKRMDNIKKMNGSQQFREASGVGDTKINALYQFYETDNSRLQFNLGLSLPGGEIKEAYNNTRLPYAMQPGSGSYELLPGLSFSSYNGNDSYGGQINTVFRLNSNNSGYKLGDMYNATIWGAKKLGEAFSLSSRLNYTISEAIEGNDKTLMPNMTPANNIAAYGGKRLDFFLGGNFIAPKGYFKGHRLAIEFGFPIYQKTDALQLETDYQLIIGWQKAF